MPEKLTESTVLKTPLTPYHPLFLFNQFGDCEGATLRPGNVHSADGWQELLEPWSVYASCQPYKGVFRY